MIACRYPFVDTRSLRQHFQLGKFGEAALRRKLPSPIYWIQPDRKILWNFELIKNYLLNGDCPAHRKVVESYLQSIQKSA